MSGIVGPSQVSDTAIICTSWVDTKLNISGILLRNDRELNKHMLGGMKSPDLEHSLKSDTLFTLIAGMVKSLDLRARGDGLGSIGCISGSPSQRKQTSR